MGVALRPAGAEREPQLRAGHVAGEPGQVGVGEREAVLALAGHARRAAGLLRPGVVRAASASSPTSTTSRLALRPSRRGRASELDLAAGADERDDSVDLVEQHAERLRVQLAEDEDRGVLGGSSSEAVSAPATDRRRSRTVTGRGVALRAAADDPGRGRP